MARPVFIDPETGARRQREQRPDGAGTKFRIVLFPLEKNAETEHWEFYHCLADGCPYDTQYSEQFDMHYFHKHEVPEAQARAAEALIKRERERVERTKERPAIPILQQF